MKRSNLVLSKPQDRVNAIVKFQENIRIYKKKIERKKKTDLLV